MEETGYGTKWVINSRYFYPAILPQEGEKKSIHVKKIEQRISAHTRNTKIKAKPNYLIKTH